MRHEIDLFGQPMLSQTSFRKDGRLRKLGYAARPGSGPKSQRCNTCAHCIRVVHGDVHSYKCEIIASRWTQCATTDIKPNAPACSEWRRRAERQSGRLMGDKS